MTRTLNFLRIIPRSEWGARYGRGNDVSRNEPFAEVVIHTEAGAVLPGDWPAITEAAKVMSLTEKQHLQAVERYHVVNRGWQGIGYSFLISRDGSIFEGRGWGRQGAHTETRNSMALGVCFLGHGDLQPATEAQWVAARWLIAEGIRLGHLRSRPKISGHRNYSQKGKTCPGNLIYPLIQVRLAYITANTFGAGPGNPVLPSTTTPSSTPGAPMTNDEAANLMLAFARRDDEMKKIRADVIVAFAERDQRIIELEAELEAVKSREPSKRVTS